MLKGIKICPDFSHPSFYTIINSITATVKGGETL
jgi:hypothetical protein